MVKGKKGGKKKSKGGDSKPTAPEIKTGHFFTFATLLAVRGCCVQMSVRMVVWAHVGT